MKIEDLKAFDAVVRHKSIVRAAEALHSEQSILTRRLQNLESTLGVALFDRSKRPLVPTPLGHRIHKEVRVVLDRMVLIRQAVQEDGEMEGVFRLGVPQFISESSAVSVIELFRRAYPQLRLQVQTATSAALVDAIEMGEIDVAAVLLSADQPLPSTIMAKRLTKLQMEVVARRGDFGDGPLQLEDIHDRGWILNPADCGFRNSLAIALAAKGLPLKINLDVAGTEVQLGLVASGLGLALVPTLQIEQSPLADKLQRLDVMDFTLNKDIWLIQPQSQGALTRPSMEFGLFIQEQFGGTP